MRNSALETRNSGQSGVEPPHSKKNPTPTFFCKCVKRKGFKSFVLKVCETKGVADAFLRKCVNLKSLGGISLEFVIFRLLGTFCKKCSGGRNLESWIEVNPEAYRGGTFGRTTPT